MLTGIDLSHVHITNWYGSQSATRAYDDTIEKCTWYHNNCPRTIIFTEGGDLKRKEWYPEYKAHRKPLPEEAKDSLVAVTQQLETWGIPVLSVPGYEADDLIATIAKQAWIEDFQVVSNDKDLYQLLSPTFHLVGKRHIGPDDCVLKWGVRPDQMRDFLAITGDDSDNIPGCPNCGPGRARDLLQKFETLDAIRAASDEDILSVRKVGPTTLASLREWDPTLALKLVTLLDDAPIDLSTLWASAA